MYYVIFGLPVAAVFAAVQIYLLKKSNKNWIRLIPAAASVLFFAAIGVLWIEPIGNAVAEKIHWGYFALIVYLTVGGIGSAMGTVFGWAFYLIGKKRKSA